MTMANYVFDNEENIYKFAAEVIQISRIANRLGIEIEEYISDLIDGGYLDTDFVPVSEEEYALKALAMLMDTIVEKYMVKVVDFV